MYAAVDMPGALTRFCFEVQDHIGNLVKEYFTDDYEAVMRDPILFGDFRTALHEDEPRVYEDIQDYEAAKALFEVRTACLQLCPYRIFHTQPRFTVAS